MALPPNWHEYSTDDGQAYFHNTATQVTQWERPVWPESLSDTAMVYKPDISDLELTERPAPSSLEEGKTRLSETDPTQIVTLSKVSETHSSMFQRFKINESLVAFQEFFDVTTEDVKARLRLSVCPFWLRSDSAENVFRTRPDFWGPLWIATTVALLMPVTGNFDLYISMSVPSDLELSQCYNLLTISAGLVFCSVAAIPLSVRGLTMFCSDDDMPMDLRHLTCVYGYSLTSLIPVSLLCLVPFGAVRWIAVVMGLLVSLWFVKVTVWNDFAKDQRPWIKWSVTALLFAGQTAIFITYRVYFFSVH